MKIENIIDETHKEIYEFEKVGDTYYYMGITYASRNDKNDIWGDDWESHYSDAMNSELDEYARSVGYDNINDFFENDSSYREMDYCCQNVNDIENKYNPVCQKTKCGENYLHGRYGINLPTPKMTVDEIKGAILLKTRKINVSLNR